MVIFDTNILIEIYRGNAAMRQSVREIGNGIFYISSITFAEFIIGAKNKADLAQIEKDLSKYTVISVNAEISKIFIKLYRTFVLSHRPGIADTLIAATALYYDLPIFTLNKKHFEFIPGIQLL